MIECSSCVFPNKDFFHKNRSKQWVVASTIMIALGILLVAAGSIALTKELLPLSVSVSTICGGVCLFFVPALGYICLPRSSSSRIQVVAGSENSVKDQFFLTPITSVRLEQRGQLKISSGEPTVLSINAEDNIIDLLDQKIEQNTLTLGTKETATFLPRKPIVYTLTLPNPLQELHVSGTGTVEIMELNGESFTCVLSGMSQVKVFSGIIGEQKLTLSGSASYTADILQSQSCNLEIQDTGTAIVNVKNTLNVQIARDGVCCYYGQPKEIFQKGAGDLRQAV